MSVTEYHARYFAMELIRRIASNNLPISEEYLAKRQKWLMQMTKFALKDKAEFHDDGVSFTLKHSDSDDILPGLYRIGNNDPDAHVYSVQHPLAQSILKDFIEKRLPMAEIVFRYTGTPKTSILEKYIGRSGILKAGMVSIESFEAEDHIVFASRTDEGDVLTEEECRCLFSLNGEVKEKLKTRLDTFWVTGPYCKQEHRVIRGVDERNTTFLVEEMEKLCEDQDGIENKKKELISKLRQMLNQVVESTTIITIRWFIVEDFSGKDMQ